MMQRTQASVRALRDSACRFCCSQRCSEVRACGTPLHVTNALNMWLHDREVCWLRGDGLVRMKQATQQQHCDRRCVGCNGLRRWAGLRSAQSQAHAWVLVLIIFVWKPPHFLGACGIVQEDGLRETPCLPLCESTARNHAPALSCTGDLCAVT